MVMGSSPWDSRRWLRASLHTTPLRGEKFPRSAEDLAAVVGPEPMVEVARTLAERLRES
jgi:hypothetical protein